MWLKRRFVVAAVLAVLAAVCMDASAANDADIDPAQWRSTALAHALTAADAIVDPYRRAEILAAIARAQVSVGGATAGDKAIHQALAAAARIDAPEFRGWVLHDIVLAQ